MNDSNETKPDFEKQQKETDSGKPESNSPKIPILKGLCINCENRETCILPKPVGGVWHCEEYL